MAFKYASIILLLTLFAVFLDTEAQNSSDIQLLTTESNYPTLSFLLDIRLSDDIPPEMLDISDIEVEIDGQTISDLSVTPRDLPISVILVMDTSSSMSNGADGNGPLSDTQVAAASFLEQLHDDDEVALITFNSQITRVQTFTQDHITVRNAILNLQASGQTALYDATVDSIDLAETATNPNPIVVLLSDGHDDGGVSSSPSDFAINTAMNRGVRVYTIGLGVNVDRSFLADLAHQSGGIFFEVSTSDRANGLRETYSAVGDIVDRLRRRYILQVELPVVETSQYEITITSGEQTFFYNYQNSNSVSDSVLENAISSNEIWDTQIEIINGVQMVFVPSGCFTMGRLVGPDVPMNEVPAHNVCFENGFYLDRFEVTNNQAQRFNGTFAGNSRFVGDDRPRDSVTWFEARDFCALRGARLPTEAEWEYAARGPSNWIYPWGDVFNPNRVVFIDNSDGFTAEVGSVTGASWTGALDMAGNVWEWTNSRFLPYPYDVTVAESPDGLDARVLRGGSYNNSAEDMYMSLRLASNPADNFALTGFRCALSIDDEPETEENEE